MSSLTNWRISDLTPSKSFYSSKNSGGSLRWSMWCWPPTFLSKPEEPIFLSWHQILLLANWMHLSDHKIFFYQKGFFKELLLDDRRIISRMTMSRIQLVKVIFQLTRLFFNPNKIYVEMFRSWKLIESKYCFFHQNKKLFL